MAADSAFSYISERKPPARQAGPEKGDTSKFEYFAFLTKIGAYLCQK
jgi:hypothetical protein